MIRPSMMIKTLIALFVLVLLIIIITRFSILFICNKKNKLAEKQISNLIPVVEKFYILNGKYPNKIEELKHLKRENNNTIFLIFSIPPIKYQATSDGFQIYYYQSPLGPFYGYDSRIKSWYNEE